MRGTIVSVLVLAITGCNLTPAYQRPQVPEPASWPQAGLHAQTLPDRWWQSFASPPLDGLVENALAANQDLAAAIQRIAQARAAAVVAGAATWPQVDAALTTTDTTRSGNSASAAAGGIRHTGQISVAYELDLFGRVAATRQAARERLAESRFDHEALRLLTVAEVTQAALNLSATGKRLALARANLANAQGVLAVLDARLDAGRVSTLERDQQRTVVATTEASVATLAQSEAGFRNQLALLSGAASPEFTAPAVAWEALVLPAVTPTVPATLLTRRPDLRRAEAQLQAAGADLGAARSALYPSLQISWDRSWTRSPAATLTTLTGSALAPLFRGGALRGEVARNEARQAELVAQYRQAVLTSYREVSDALDAQRQSEARSQALDRAAAAARDAYAGARARFEAGAADYQVLLDALRSQIQADDAAVGARLERFTAAVSLYRALGGNTAL
ncbi:efflux transporter outer membrane subunit [Immundisolibacter sp.]|uniref:efflux transporter outer membrane subunit n=1 Tax=Immundisolibacter sp. TaxID=1934948 RepID=UPI003564E786